MRKKSAISETQIGSGIISMTQQKDEILSPEFHAGEGVTGAGRHQRHDAGPKPR